MGTVTGYVMYASLNLHFMHVTKLWRGTIRLHASIIYAATAVLDSCGLLHQTLLLVSL